MYKVHVEDNSPSSGSAAYYWYYYCNIFETRNQKALKPVLLCIWNFLNFRRSTSSSGVSTCTYLWVPSTSLQTRALTAENLEIWKYTAAPAPELLLENNADTTSKYMYLNFEPLWKHGSSSALGLLAALQLNDASWIWTYILGIIILLIELP